MFGKLTPVVKNILLINGVLFLLEGSFGFRLSDYFGLRVVFSSDFMPYQFFTYMWLHGGFGHILGNMIAVLVFGPMLETVWGSKRFLTFYLICGVGAGVLYGSIDFLEKSKLKNTAEAYIANPSPEAFEQFIIENKNPIFNLHQLSNLLDAYYENDTNVEIKNETRSVVQKIYDIFITHGNMIGASGAVFGILFAFAYLFPNTELFLLFPPMPVKAKYLVFFYALYELYSEFQRIPGDNVAHLAHLGGMFIAFILLRFWKSNNRFY